MGVLRAVHLDYQARVLRQEVSDVAIREHYLASKFDAELLPPYGAPKPRFRGGWSPTHAVRASLQELVALSALTSE